MLYLGKKQLCFLLSDLCVVNDVKNSYNFYIGINNDQKVISKASEEGTVCVYYVPTVCDAL